MHWCGLLLVVGARPVRSNSMLRGKIKSPDITESDNEYVHPRIKHERLQAYKQIEALEARQGLERSLN
jgi:hypothetical protein